MGMGMCIYRGGGEPLDRKAKRRLVSPYVYVYIHVAAAAAAAAKNNTDYFFI